MTFNTHNALGSVDDRDVQDNAANLDLAVNSLSQTFVDRLGVTRDTLEGIYQKSAYYRAGTFEAGYTLTNNRQTLAYGNVEYSWSGAFPKVVTAGATPSTAGGIGALLWVDRTDEALRGELSAVSGISMLATNKFYVYVHSAPDDGVTDATSYFSEAAELALANNVQVIVKPPATSYFLASDPVVAKEVNVLASPNWFSGTGKLPIHAYQQLSEGVDPRELELGYSVLMGTDSAQVGRKWAIQGAVDITQPPVGVGTASDSVGISGRGYSRAPNARVWGGVTLALLGPETTGGEAGAIGFEIDINNNKGHVGQLDGVTRAKGLLIASGGAFRPEEGRLMMATMPNNESGDNRFYVGNRFTGDSFLRAVQWFDTEITAPAQSMGHKTRTEMRFSDGAIGWSNAQNATTGAIQSKAIKATGGFEWLSSNGSKQLLTINDSSLQHKIPDLQATTDTTSGNGINADVYCKFNVTTTGSIGGITGGANGQTIYIANFSGGSLTLSRGTNMRTPGGLSVSIPQLAVACFTMQGGVWLFNYVSAANG